MIPDIEHNYTVYSQVNLRTNLGTIIFKSFVLCREVACPLLGGSKCIRTIGKPIIWDLEKSPL